MREPGTSFEYKGITLHVVKHLLRARDSCFGCYGCDANDDANEHCRPLAHPNDQTEGTCGTVANGVVFVQDIEAFKAACVAHTLTK